ncbi:MAG: 50S ribosomal protein L30 [Anaerolineaceae bacterium]|nr:50S ribosomal protein L30 [Anaerolineaceae bacterium]
MPRKKKEPKNLLRITLVRSAIGYSKKHKATVRALGLRRINHAVQHDDTPVIRGMIAKINHLIKVEEQVEK